MSQASLLTVALVGNPNSGKSTLFNRITGLQQKVGNFPGVTVDKKIGYCTYNDKRAEIIDLPGTYSIYPKSKDEQVVLDTLCNKDASALPNLVVVIVDASNLKRSLLLFTQVRDLGLPTLLVLNMVDVLHKKREQIDKEGLSQSLGVNILFTDGRKGSGVEELKAALFQTQKKSKQPLFEVREHAPAALQRVLDTSTNENSYVAYQRLLQKKQKNDISEASSPAHTKANGSLHTDFQKTETLYRYDEIAKIIAAHIRKNQTVTSKTVSQKIDRLLLHKIGGYLIFFMVLALIFQVIFAWAQVPMDFIDEAFTQLAGLAGAYLPAGPLTDLISEGIIPGIGGVVIFIPQIALLFAFIAALEESGYMARVVFLMDSIMRKFGLNGRSVVPLVSGVACAIPAIMATRTIDRWKERLITIFVTPLMSCSARLPVYAILIALVVPDRAVLGFFNLQGLSLMAMYLLGLFAALFSAFVLKMMLKTKERSYLVMELPSYRMPRWPNVGLTMYEKSKTFVLEAGKIIMAVAIILWVLASYGPTERMDNAEHYVTEQYGNTSLSPEERENAIASYRLENSYAGIVGKSIEPLIEPLGYDWKIGIALITSLAAREVFVATMATIYSIGDTEDEATIKNRMLSETNPATGGPRYTPAVGFSLMVFYAFAMQCMSTLAIVRRETKSWKWPLLQFVYMTGLAYLSAFLTYQLFS